MEGGGLECLHGIINWIIGNGEPGRTLGSWVFNGVPSLKEEQANKKTWKVKKLMLTNDGSYSWDYNPIYELFIPQHAGLIMSFLFPSRFIPDRCVWLDHCNVVFSVKKAYCNCIPIAGQSFLLKAVLILDSNSFFRNQIKFCGLNVNFNTLSAEH